MLDVARHFCERWNFIKHDKAKNIDTVPYLQPPLGGMGQQQRFIEEEAEEHHYKRYRHKHRTHGVTGTMRAQVLRSSAKWSSGVELEVRLNHKEITSSVVFPYLIYLPNLLFLALYSKCLYCYYSCCSTLCLH